MLVSHQLNAVQSRVHYFYANPPYCPLRNTERVNVRRYENPLYKLSSGEFFFDYRLYFTYVIAHAVSKEPFFLYAATCA